MLPLAALLIADTESAFSTQLFFSVALFPNASALLPLLHCLYAVSTAPVQSLPPYNENIGLMRSHEDEALEYAQT